MAKFPTLLNKFCDVVWEYDVNTNNVFLHFDGLNPALCNQWISYDVIDRLYYDEICHEMDRDIWQKHLSAQALQAFMASDEDEKQCYLRYETPEKGSEWREVYFQRMAHGRMLIASRDVKDLQRNETIAKAIVPEFDFVASIEIDSGRYVMYYSEQNNRYHTEVSPSRVGQYEDALSSFCKYYVEGEEAEALQEKMQVSNVIEELRDKKEYSIYFSAKYQGETVYKKVRFSYVNEKKDVLLMTRVDVGELVKERKLREREVEKHYQYLQNMPMSFCSLKVLLDANGDPYDFKFIYSNRAQELMVGVSEGALIGKNFYEFFEDTDPRWLSYFYETAFEGIHHVFRIYSPEIQKHLMVYTFCLEYGNCECVLLDVSEQHFLTQELERSRENLRRILAATASVVFQYRIESEDIALLEKRHKVQKDVVPLKNLEEQMISHGLLDEDFKGFFDGAFRRMREGEHTLTVDLRGRSNTEEPWKWYRMTMFDFRDGFSHERQVFGFVQNIDRDRSRVEEYRKRAQIDALTEVYNSGTGKYKISRALKIYREGEDAAYAMLVIDMDDFKKINDTQGHLMGDKVLVEFAGLLRRTFRTGDLIFRLGGDEFVVFVERLFEPAQSIDAMVHRLQLELRKPLGDCPKVSCSVGAFVSNKAHSFDECYEYADSALYETKKKHKGHYSITLDL